MIIGGGLAIYVRELYTRYGSTISNRENFANVFPMLTLITVVIIFVVKSSLTLSLGLVGALSIVRFRTAIKSAEELAYLFLCIAIGLALGADHRVLTVAAVIVISAFILARQHLGRRRRAHNLLLTITGDAKRFFEKEASVVDVIETLAGKVTGRCCTARSKSLTSLCRLQSHPAQYVSGIPSAAILLSISHPIRCSTRCLANVRARISGPMIAL